MDLSFQPRATIPFLVIGLAVSGQKGNKNKAEYVRWLPEVGSYS